MDKDRILIKPHHFVDIIAAYGAGQTVFSPHPYGHALHVVARRILEERGLTLLITGEVDSICAPCRCNRDGRCIDAMPERYSGFPKIPRGKGEWNTLIDTRWCREMGLSFGALLPAPELGRRLLDVSRRIPRIYRELPGEYSTDLRRNLEKGLLLFLRNQA